jgi:hypothetical protein
MGNICVFHLIDANGFTDDLLETALRLESLEDWTATVQEDRAIYRVSHQKREAAFREIVLSLDLP